MIDDYSGLQKAAILLITLGPEKASAIFQHLKEDEIESLTLEIANTRSVSPQDKESVLDEYYQVCLAQQYIAEGGIGYAKELLEKALDIRKILINRRKTDIRHLVELEQVLENGLTDLRGGDFGVIVFQLLFDVVDHFFELIDGHRTFFGGLRQAAQDLGLVEQLGASGSFSHDQRHILNLFIGRKTLATFHTFPAALHGVYSVVGTRIQHPALPATNWT